ncbi:MAG: hypothetical protein LBU91_08545 [Bacteroidales bacterium]|jgi:hypothetical protein|nr:hypothetical protein [Bacteroidales bacterium]
MMRKIVLLISLTISFYNLHAQAFKINENRASFGVGLGWKNNASYKEPGISRTRFWPSPNVLIERSVIPIEDVGVIAAGAQFGFHHGSGKRDAIPNSVKESWTEVFFVPRIALYFQELFYDYDFPENIDWYAGVGFGFNYVSHHFSEDIPNIHDRNAFKLGYNFFVGGRYYFTPKAAFFAEFGYGLSYLNAGITINY